MNLTTNQKNNKKMIENITEIENGLGLKEGTLKDAIASEEATTIEMPVGKMVNPEEFEIIAKEDYETRVNNIKTESKKAGVEIAVKEARNSLGLEFEGKTIDNLLKSHSDKVLADAKIEPEKKVKELAGDKTKLQGKVEEWEGKYNELQTQMLAKDTKLKRDQDILSFMPDKLTLPNRDVLTLFNSNYEVATEDGVAVVKSGGETLKDTNLNPKLLKDVVVEFASGYKKPIEGGAGDGDTTGAPKGGSIDAFTEEMVKKEISPNSEAFQLEMKKRISDGTLVM